MKRPTTPAVFFWLALSGCVADTGNSEAGSSTSSIGSSSTDTMSPGGTSSSSEAETAAPTCGDCDSGEGCVGVEVVRVVDTSLQPWEWGGGVIGTDGIGTLIVSAVTTDDNEILSQATVADADMLPPDARYIVDLGCLPADAPFNLTAFLDDDMNAQNGEWISTSFSDACMNNPRILVCEVTPGESITAELALSSQCYHSFDVPSESTCEL
jgi:hypothetical protein